MSICTHVAAVWIVHSADRSVSSLHNRGCQLRTADAKRHDLHLTKGSSGQKDQNPRYVPYNYHLMIQETLVIGWQSRRSASAGPIGDEVQSSPQSMASSRYSSYRRPSGRSCSQASPGNTVDPLDRKPRSGTTVARCGADIFPFGADRFGMGDNASGWRGV